MGKLINTAERIGYTFKEGEKTYTCYGKEYTTLMIYTPTGKTKEVTFGNSVLYLCGNHNVSTKEAAEELIAKGEALKTTGAELITEFYNLDHETITLLKYGCDLRTLNYIEDLKNKHGIIEDTRFISYDEEEKMEVCFKFDYGINTSDAVVGQVDDGTWCCQYGYMFEIDDYCVEKYYFNRKPTEEDCRAAILIEKVMRYIGQYRYEFVCWECGKSTHWLDTEGDLVEKFESLKEKYCGC